MKKIAYLVSRFPKISETFILTEILELKRLGVPVEIFTLVLEREPVRHAEVEALLRRTHSHRPFSKSLLLAQLFWLMSSPFSYLKAWVRAIKGNWSSPKFLLRALAVVPIAATFAKEMQSLQIEHVH